MKMGFNSREVGANSLEEIFIFGFNEGFRAVHLNLNLMAEKTGTNLLPSKINEKLLDNTSELAARNNIDIVSVSGTFNLIDPDRERLEENFRRFPEICRSAAKLGCPMITLCTGTGNGESMWKYDSVNDTDSAWEQMESSMDRLLEEAKKYSLYLGIEPEISNVVSSPEKAKKLIDEMDSDTLRIVFDPANLFTSGLTSQKDIRLRIETAYKLLEGRVEQVHGKDLQRTEGAAYTYAGDGVIDFAFLKEMMEKSAYNGPIILHGFKKIDEFRRGFENMKKIFG